MIRQWAIPAAARAHYDRRQSGSCRLPIVPPSSTMKRPFLPLVSMPCARGRFRARTRCAPRAPRHRSHLSADGFEGARRQPEGLRRRSRQRDLPPCAVALPVGRLEFSGMIPALQARKIDAILSSMAITEKREKQILFSSKLFRFKSRLVARPGSGVDSTTASLAGKRIGVQSGTQFESWALAHWAPAGVGVMPYKSWTTCSPISSTAASTRRCSAPWKPTTASCARRRARASRSSAHRSTRRSRRRHRHAAVGYGAQGVDRRRDRVDAERRHVRPDREEVFRLQPVRRLSRATLTFHPLLRFHFVRDHRCRFAPRRSCRRRSARSAR